MKKKKNLLESSRALFEDARQKLKNLVSNQYSGIYYPEIDITGYYYDGSDLENLVEGKIQAVTTNEDGTLMFFIVYPGDYYSEEEISNKDNEHWYVDLGGFLLGDFTIYNFIEEGIIC